MFDLQKGDVSWVTVLKADGRIHRRWRACVESASEASLVMVAGIGNPAIHSDIVRPQRYHIRFFYWPERYHNLLEFYHADGRLAYLYSDICSPVIRAADGIAMTDHELDVLQRAGQEARIVDEDEFAAAINTFGYSTELQRRCREAAASALEIVQGWNPVGITAELTRCP